MFKKLIVHLILTAFLFISVGPLPDVSAQTIIDLPAPGTMVNRSVSFEPLQLKGVLVNIKNPLRFDFLLDKGDSGLYGQPLKDEIIRLTKYFLTCLTVPEDDLWVNLSPYEKDRIIPGNFGITLMGNDLLEQDYLLKQIMASLSYPENELGKRFWQKVYRKAYELYGTTDIPINTFNKVWIVPKSADVYAQGNSAFVVKSQLDVMLEADYKAYVHHLDNNSLARDSKGFSQSSGAYSQVLRDVILPELRSEVNEGKNFAVVRQVYNAFILATWYKRHLKDSLLGRMYVGRNEVGGVDIADKNAKERIFRQYLRAYKKCVYNYIKEDYDPVTQQTVPRKYASGGLHFTEEGYSEVPNPRGMEIGTDLAMATVDVTATNSDGTVTFPDMRTMPPYYPLRIKFHRAILNTPINKFSHNQAMIVPRSLRPLVLSMLFAVGGLTMTPTMTIAAAPVSPGVKITANMNTQEVIRSIDRKIVTYKKAVRKQESLLNMFGVLGRAENTDLKISGLDEEEATAKTLFAAGKVKLDGQLVVSLESANLTGQIGSLDRQIWQRKQKLKSEKAEFARRNHYSPMHGGERSRWQLDINYDKGVLDHLTVQKDKLNEEKIEIEKNIHSLEAPPLPNVKNHAEELANQVVPNAIGSGVLSPSVVPPTTQPPATPPVNLKSASNPPPAQGSQPLASQHIKSRALPSSTQLAPPVNVQSTSNLQLLPLLQNSQITSSGGSNMSGSNLQHHYVLPTPRIISSINRPPALVITHSSTMISGGIRASAGSPPPDKIISEILQNISANWPWYSGIAVLGIGIGMAGMSFVKKRSTNNQDKPLRNSSGNPERSSGQWAFNVGGADQGPPPPDAAEEAWIKQQQRTDKASLSQQIINSPVVSTVNDQPVKSSLGEMDILGMVMSTGLAGIYSGGDLKTILTASLSSLFVTRLIYAVLTFIHENSHNLTAWAQSPKDYRKIWTWPNFFANYNLPNWLRLGTAFGKPTQRPGVDLPLTGKARRLNQIAGFVIVSAVSGLAFWSAVKIGLWLPLFGSLSAASIFAIYNSWISDIWRAPAEGRIYCGDSGVIWLPKKFRSKINGPNGKSHLEDFFPKFVQDGLVNMRMFSGLRGDQGKGLSTWGETADEDVVPIGYKKLKSKRARKSIAEDANEGFKQELEEALSQDIQPLDEVREVMTHDRFLTQGTPSQKGLHPHVGVPETRILCFYKKGEYQKRKRTIVSIVIENGDNNFHKKHGRVMSTRDIREFYPIKFHMKKDVFIEPNDKFPHGYYDYLPSGDAPALALQEQWDDNQGDWWAASRFAVDEVFYKNDKEAMEYNLSEDEVNAMGDFYMRVYGNGHEPILIRPKLIKKDKTLADSWVTQEMVKENPKLAFQYDALEKLREDLIKHLLSEVEKARADENASVVGHILNRLQQLHPEEDFRRKLDNFVNMTVKRFFTADILEAAKEIDELEVEGAYGVRILSSKYPGRGIFWTKGQSIALGVNTEAGYMAYNSEHTSLMSDFGDAPPVQEILFLNSEGQGQLTETNYNEDTQALEIRAWSPAQKRFLKKEELQEWRMELNSKNKYWTPLVKRDPKTVTDEDIADITRVTRDSNEKWDDPDSFVRQSGEYWVDKLASRFVESYIKENSRFYKVMQGNLLYFVDQEAQKCQGTQCSTQETHRRAAALLREIQNDPRILSYLKSRLDQLVAYEADVLSKQIIKKEKTEDVLFPRLKIIDEQLSEFMSREIQILTENLISNNVQFLNDFQNEQGKLALNQNEIERSWNSEGDGGAGILRPSAGGKGLPSKDSVGSGEAVIYATGLEDSLWIGAENFRDMMQIFFPAMPIETDSSNKSLDLKPNDRHKVGRRTLGFIVSKSGATSPTKNTVVPLKQIATPDDIIIMTSRVDTLLGLSLGQKFYTGAPFCKRIFPTGNNPPTEVNSVSEVELLVNQINLVLYTVKRMKELFPDQRPWGMDVSEANIKRLEKWRDNMVNKARHLTGVDEDGNPGTYRENQKIIHDGLIFGKMLAETPISNLATRAYVFSIIYLGVPAGALAAYIEKKTGLTLHSSGWGHLAWALLDTTIACSMPWWISTGLYRSLSGRVQRWARLGPPKVVIGDIPVLNQVIEISASKRAALAVGSMDPDIHGGNAQDHYGARYLHRVRRGTVEIFGLPEDPHALGHVLLTDSQSNVRTDMTIGNRMWDYFLGKRFKAGPEIFTVGSGDVDPNLSQHHMSTGPLETVIINGNGERELRPDVTETLAQFHSRSFEVFDRLIAYNVFFNAGFHWGTNWGPWQIWRQGESFSRTGVLSTPSPRNGPKKKLPEFHDADRPYSAAVDTKRDFALLSEKGPQQAVSRDGGIAMNSRMMQLNISGETQNNNGDNDGAMSLAVIKGVVPQVSGIVTVTPQMLRAMLGTGYLN